MKNKKVRTPTKTVLFRYFIRCVVWVKTSRRQDKANTHCLFYLQTSVPFILFILFIDTIARKGKIYTYVYAHHKPCHEHRQAVEAEGPLLLSRLSNRPPTYLHLQNTSVNMPRVPGTYHRARMTSYTQTPCSYERIHTICLRGRVLFRWI